MDDTNDVNDDTLQEIEEQSILKAHACNICDGKSYSSLWMLKTHLRKVHHIDLTQKCNICNKEFPNKMKLKSHMKSTHTEKKAPRKMGRPRKPDDNVSKSTLMQCTSKYM